MSKTFELPFPPMPGMQLLVWGPATENGRGIGKAVVLEDLVFDPEDGTFLAAVYAGAGDDGFWEEAGFTVDEAAAMVAEATKTVRNRERAKKRAARVQRTILSGG